MYSQPSKRRRFAPGDADTTGKRSVPDKVSKAIVNTQWTVEAFRERTQFEMDDEDNSRYLKHDHVTLAIAPVAVKDKYSVLMQKDQSSYGEIIYRFYPDLSSSRFLPESDEERTRRSVTYQKVSFDDMSHAYILQSGVMVQATSPEKDEDLSDDHGAHFCVLQFPGLLVTASRLYSFAFEDSRESYFRPVIDSAKHELLRFTLTHYFMVRKEDPSRSYSDIFSNYSASQRDLVDNYVPYEILVKLEHSKDLNVTHLRPLERAVLSLLIRTRLKDDRVVSGIMVDERIHDHIRRAALELAQELVDRASVGQEVFDYSPFNEVASLLGTRMHKYLENRLRGIDDVEFEDQDPDTFRCATRVYEDMFLNNRERIECLYTEGSFGSYKYKICGKMDVLLKARGAVGGDGGVFTGIDYKRSSGLLAGIRAGVDAGSVFERGRHGLNGPLKEFGQMEKTYVVKGPLSFSSKLFGYAFQLGVYRNLLKLNGMQVSPHWYLVVIHPQLVLDGTYYVVVEIDVTTTTFSYYGRDSGMTVEQLVDLAFQVQLSKVQVLFPRSGT